MKRFKIINGLKSSIRNSKLSLRELNNLLGFEIRNILNKNKTINENHLRKIEKVLNKRFNLKEIKLDFTKNLGNYSFTKPRNKIKKNPDLAEFIGIMLGDGNLWDNRIKIAFNKDEKEFFNYVKKLFEEIFGIIPKQESSKISKGAFLVCTNKFATEELIKFGLKRGNKLKNKLGIPNWIKENKNYSRRCLKGLIETDGCIYFSKRDKQIYVKFTNFNKKLLEDFLKITKNLGYAFAKANNENVCLYRKDEVANFIKEIKPIKSRGLWASLVKL